MADMVEHPAHYGGDTTYEVIKVAEAWGFDKDAYLFNVLKYIGRPGKGNVLEDLKKARFYLDRKIARLEAQQARYPQDYAAKTEAEIREVMRTYWSKDSVPGLKHTHTSLGICDERCPASALEDLD